MEDLSVYELAFKTFASALLHEQTSSTTMNLSELHLTFSEVSEAVLSIKPFADFPFPFPFPLPSLSLPFPFHFPSLPLSLTFAWPSPSPPHFPFPAQAMMDLYILSKRDFVSQKQKLQ